MWNNYLKEVNTSIISLTDVPIFVVAGSKVGDCFPSIALYSSLVICPGSRLKKQEYQAKIIYQSQEGFRLRSEEGETEDSGMTLQLLSQYQIIQDRYTCSESIHC